MKSRKHELMLFGSLIAILLMSSCSSGAVETPVSENAKLNVVATTGMIADVVRGVGGDRVEVVQLMGPGIDPHLYTATEGDVDRLLNAEIIFYNGLNLEARLADIFEQMARQKPTVAVGEGLPEELILTELIYNAPDPHIWMDAGRWLLVVDVVTEGLVEIDPEGEEEYRKNGEAYTAQVSELDEYVRNEVARITPSKRVLVTAHDAFQYFGEAYGIEVFSPQGITTESEASVEDIRRVIDVLVDRDIPAIFVESSVPPDVVEAIVEGTAAAGHSVQIGGELFSDAMGADGTPEGTYPGMIRHNTDTIVSALSGG
jgi:manganese/zinc/iron transport system substrate-binding protein